MPRNRPGSTDWIYVVANDAGMEVDVHVFAYDDAGRNVYGVEYPHGALTGTGQLAGHVVNCVSAEWMFRFKTSYEPKPKDLADVAALAGAFGFEIPDSHRR